MTRAFSAPITVLLATLVWPLSSVAVDALQPLEQPAQLTAEATITPERTLIVTGTTNLPDGTRLLISLSNEEFWFQAADYATVLDGTFTAGPLGPDTGLMAAEYELRIGMVAPRIQPDSVRAIIGDGGENLAGELVRELPNSERIVEHSFTLSVGTAQEIEQADREYQEVLYNLRTSIARLVAEGRAMETYRNTDDFAALQMCGRLMRQHQAEADLIIEQTEALPRVHMYLRMAAFELHACVSCRPDALDACDRAATALEADAPGFEN